MADDEKSEGMTKTQAARLLGKSRWTINNYIDLGLLTVRMIEAGKRGTPILLRSQVEALLPRLAVDTKPAAPPEGGT